MRSQQRSQTTQLSALPLAEALRIGSPLLRNSDTQVAVALELLELIAPDSPLADARLVVRALAAHLTARHSAVAERVLELLLLFDSCERAPVVLLLLDVLPRFFPPDASTLAVVASLKTLLQSDRAYLVPILGALSELPLSASSKRDMLDLSLAALEIVDSSDVPTVVRTLLRTMSKQTCDQIVGAIRDECAVLPHAARSVVQEVLGHALRVNGLAVSGFVRSIGEAREPLRMLDLYVLLTLISRPLTRGAATRAALRAARAGTLTFDALADVARFADEPTWAPLTATLIALHSFLVIAVAKAQVARPAKLTLRGCIVGVCSALLQQRHTSKAAVLASVLAFAAAPHGELARAASEALVVLAQRQGRALASHADHVQDLLSVCVCASAAASDPQQLHCICLSLALLARREPRLQASLLIGVQKRIFGLPSDRATRCAGLALACHVVRSGGARGGEARAIVAWLCRIAEGGADSAASAPAFDALAHVAPALEAELCQSALEQSVRPAATALGLLDDSVGELQLQGGEGSGSGGGGGSEGAAHCCATWRAFLALSYEATGELEELEEGAAFGARFRGDDPLTCALNASTALVCHIVRHPQPQGLATLMITRLRNAEPHLALRMPPRMLVAAVALLTPREGVSPLRLRLLCELCDRLGVRRAGSSASAPPVPTMLTFLSAACGAHAALDSRSALHRLLASIIDSRYLRAVFVALQALSEEVLGDWKERREAEAAAEERSALLAAHLSVVMRLLELVQLGELEAAPLLRACAAGVGLVDSSSSSATAKGSSEASATSASSSSSSSHENDSAHAVRDAEALLHFFTGLWMRVQHSTLAVLLGEIVVLVSARLEPSRGSEVAARSVSLLHTVFPHEADSLFAWLPLKPTIFDSAWSATRALLSPDVAESEESVRRAERAARKLPARGTPLRQQHIVFQLSIAFALCDSQHAAEGLQHAVRALEEFVERREPSSVVSDDARERGSDIDVNTHPMLKSLTAETFSLLFDTLLPLCLLVLSRSAPAAPEELGVASANDERTPYCCTRACTAAFLRLLRLQSDAAESGLLKQGSIKTLLRSCATALQLLRVKIESSLEWRASYAEGSSSSSSSSSSAAVPQEEQRRRLLGPGALRPLMREALALVRSIDLMCSAIKSAETSVRSQPRSGGGTRRGGRSGRGARISSSKLQLRTVEWQSIPALLREVESFRHYVHEACAVHHIDDVTSTAPRPDAAVRSSLPFVRVQRARSSAACLPKNLADWSAALSAVVTGGRVEAGGDEEQEEEDEMEDEGAVSGGRAAGAAAASQYFAVYREPSASSVATSSSEQQARKRRRVALVSG